MTRRVINNVEYFAFRTRSNSCTHQVLGPCAMSNDTGNCDDRSSHSCAGVTYHPVTDLRAQLYALKEK